MKKLLIIIFALISFQIQAQTVKPVNVANDSTAIGQNLAKGNLLIDYSTGTEYQLIAPIPSSGTIKTYLSSLQIINKDIYATKIEVNDSLANHLTLIKNNRDSIDSVKVQYVRADGTIPFTAPVNGVFPVTAANLATKEYVDNSVSFIADFYFVDSISNVAGYYRMINDAIGEPLRTFTASGLTTGNGQLLQTFITDTLQPGVTVLKKGVYITSITAATSTVATNKTTNLYYEFYLRDTLGTETLIGTSHLSANLTSTLEPYDLKVVNDSIREINSKDRFVVKIYADINMSGSTTNVTLEIGNGTDAKFSVPTTSDILSTIFVRQDGTTPLSADWNAVHNVYAPNITANTDSIPALRTDINKNIDSITIHRDSINNYYTYITNINDSVSTHTDTLKQHRIDINKNTVFNQDSTIHNQTATVQNAGFNISGNGTIGDTLFTNTQFNGISPSSPYWNAYLSWNGNEIDRNVNFGVPANVDTNYAFSTHTLNSQWVMIHNRPVNRSVINTENWISVPDSNNNYVLEIQGQQAEAEMRGTDTLFNAIGNFGYSVNSGTGNIVNAIANFAKINNYGTGTITNAFGYKFTQSNQGNSHITNKYAFYANSLDSATNNYGFYATGFGSGTNNYGLFLGNVSGGATNNYAIYTNQGKVHFGDNMDISGSLTGTTGTFSGNVSAASITPTNLSTGYIPYKSSTTLIDSPIYTDGTNAFVGYTADPTSGNKFAVNGNSYFNGNINMAGNSKFFTRGDITLLNNAPLYGIGLSNVVSSTNYFMQFSDYFGLLFATNGASQLAIDRDGHLLAGYTSSQGAYKLQVNGNSYFNGTGTFAGTVTAPTINLTTGATVGYVLQCTNATTGAGNWAPQQTIATANYLGLAKNVDYQDTLVASTWSRFGGFRITDTIVYQGYFNIQVAAKQIEFGNFPPSGTAEVGDYEIQFSATVKDNTGDTNLGAAIFSNSTGDTIAMQHLDVTANSPNLVNLIGTLHMTTAGDGIYIAFLTSNGSTDYLTVSNPRLIIKRFR